jgi:hypothetical protein
MAFDRRLKSCVLRIVIGLWVDRSAMPRRRSSSYGQRRITVVLASAHSAQVSGGAELAEQGDFLTTLRILRRENGQASIRL